MSLNQSRAEKSEAQVRKPGRSGSSNYPRSSSGGAGKGGSGTAPPPSPSISSSPSLSTNRGFKKSGNGQGGQSKVGPASTNSEPNAAVAANRAVQNGTHVQSHVHGVSDVPVSVTAKPIDSSVPRSSRSLPKAPSSQTTSGASDSAVPATPSKGDAPRAFPLQFGTISPGFMNGMQIPARTSSAPPNLDEQKRDQARHNSVRGVPTMPIPPVLKQQQMRKDVGSLNQSNTASSHPQPQAKRDIHIPIPAAPAVTAQKSSVLPMTGMSMPMPFQQPQVPMQFGVPTPQIQSQGGTTPSLQMLPVGNAAQVQQQVFVPSLQSHPLQPQGMMHQGQSLGFAPQMGHQMVPQLGNLGIGMPPQFAQQQAGKFGAPRKAVKITHPDTHEELKLDNKRTDSHLDVGSSGPRSHPNVPPQSQPIPSFPPAHSINYYPIPNSYNSAPIFFQPSSSLPLTGSQMTPSSSASRYNYSVGQGGQAISFMNPSAINPLPVSKAGPPMQGMSEPVNVERTHDGHVTVSAPTASVQVTVKPPVFPLAEKAGISSVAVNPSNVMVSAPTASVQVTVKPPAVPLAEKAGISSVAVNPSTGKGEPSKLLRSPGEASFHHQQREIERGSENNFQQPKSVSESPETIPFPATVISSAAASLAVSMHIPPSSTESVPVAPAEESTSVASNAEGRRKESIRRSDSFKDQHKKPSKKEPRHSQQQHQKDLTETEDDAQSKAEIDDWDWEDLVEISSPKLKTLENGEQLDGASKHDDEYGSGVSGKKKYSKDFLLTFSEQYTDLPLGFEIGTDIVNAIVSGPVANPHLVERESYRSSGRIIYRPSGGSRPDRRGSSIVDDDKWSKAPGPFASGRDPRLDVGHGGAVLNFRPGQGGNQGILRNPRGQSSVSPNPVDPITEDPDSSSDQYGSGILSGPIKSLASPGGMARNSPDADRWQHDTGIHKGMEADGLKKKRPIVPRPLMDVILSFEPRTKVTSKMRKTFEAEPALATVITSAPVARPFPAVAMTFSAEAMLVMTASEAVPIAPSTPTPEARAPEAPVGVEPITILTPSVEEQAPEVPPSWVRREVVGETPGSVVPVRSVAHYPAVEAELLAGRTDALVGYTTTPEATIQASAASGIRGTSEPTPETLPSGYHMALLNPWAAKHAPEAKIADTLSLRHVNFMNDYAAVCYQSLPMMVEVKERLKEMERLEAERAKFVVEKVEQEARRAELEAQRVELEKLLEASAAEREELRRAAAEGRARELALQGEVNQLQALLDVANPEVKHLREAVRCLKISLEDVEGDASRLEKDLERVRHEATKGLALQRTVLEVVAAADQERLRGELEARAASQVAAAVVAYKESAERAREMDKLYFFGYNTGFDTCLAEVKKLHPTIDLDALTANEA